MHPWDIDHPRELHRDDLLLSTKRMPDQWGVISLWNLCPSDERVWERIGWLGFEHSVVFTIVRRKLAACYVLLFGRLLRRCLGGTAKFWNSEHL